MTRRTFVALLLGVAAGVYAFRRVTRQSSVLFMEDPATGEFIEIGEVVSITPPVPFGVTWAPPWSSDLTSPHAGVSPT